MRELTLKHWLMNLAMQNGTSVEAMYTRYYRYRRALYDEGWRFHRDHRLFGNPILRKENPRVIFVQLP